MASAFVSLPSGHAGLGLRQPHYLDFQVAQPPIAFVEVHAENFFNLHGPAFAVLEAVRAHTPVSLHGVGLALGSACDVDQDHLAKLHALASRIEPFAVSEHLCFARGALPDQRFMHANDLLPIARTRESLALLCAHISEVQDRLRRPILVENLSEYVGYSERDYDDVDFLARVVRRTGCQLLLDLQNLWVNALNAQLSDPSAAVLRFVDSLLEAVSPAAIGEIHLAGSSAQTHPVIDDHAGPVTQPLWRLYADVLARLGPRHTLIERDDLIPPLPDLKAEVACADKMLRATPLRAPTPVPRRPEPGIERESFKTVREAARQRDFLAALLNPGGLPPEGLTAPAPTLEAGFAAYRRNGPAHGARALRLQFPTVAAMTGERPFHALADRHWRAHPPVAGDLAHLGRTFSAFLRAQRELDPWPWLPDAAALDWACWIVQSHPVGDFDHEDLTALARGDLDLLPLRFAPATGLVCSPYPIGQLRALHAAPEPSRTALAETLSLPPESVWVWRRGHEVCARVLSPDETRWMRALAQCASLQAALDEAPDTLDLAAWLSEAVAEAWLMSPLLTTDAPSP